MGKSTPFIFAICFGAVWFFIFILGKLIIDFPEHLAIPGGFMSMLCVSGNLTMIVLMLAPIGLIAFLLMLMNR